MSTTTQPLTVEEVLNAAQPNTLADATALVQLGTMLTFQKKDMTGLSSVVSITLDPPAQLVQYCRVVAGANTGLRQIADSGDTATSTVALLSDDGSTITFETSAAVTHVIVGYIPAPAVAMSSEFDNQPA